jgi:hypothetical protein
MYEGRGDGTREKYMGKEKRKKVTSRGGGGRYEDDLSRW